MGSGLCACSSARCGRPVSKAGHVGRAEGSGLGDDHGKRLANQALTGGIDLGEDGEATIRLTEPLAAITSPETFDVSGSSTSEKVPPTGIEPATFGTGNQRSIP